MSAMRSASSMTTWRTSATDRSPRSIRSMARPGVQTAKSTPPLSALICFSMGSPP